MLDNLTQPIMFIPFGDAVFYISLQFCFIIPSRSKLTYDQGRLPFHRLSKLQFTSIPTKFSLIPRTLPTLHDEAGYVQVRVQLTTNITKRTLSYNYTQFVYIYIHILTRSLRLISCTHSFSKVQSSLIETGLYRLAPRSIVGYSCPCPLDIYSCIRIFECFSV